jgi:hypothetical protein
MPQSVLSVVQVQADGRVLAEAEIRRTEVPGVVASAMHVESGHLPLGTGARLVDAVLADPEVGRAERLVATMPLNDTEMLDRVRQRSGGWPRGPPAPRRSSRRGWCPRRARGRPPTPPRRR